MADPFIGEIRMFGGTFAPVGWAYCDGSLISIADNPALFNLVGTTYGGDGQQTFGLPNLLGRIPLHMGTNPSTGTPYVIGQLAGTETVTLTSNQLPVHGHALNANSGSGGQISPSNNVLGAPAGGLLYTNFNATAPMAPGSIASAGGGQPHDNLMPFLAITFIIALEGIYPSQN